MKDRWAHGDCEALSCLWCYGLYISKPTGRKETERDAVGSGLPPFRGKSRGHTAGVPGTKEEVEPPPCRLPALLHLVSCAQRLECVKQARVLHTLSRCQIFDTPTEIVGPAFCCLNLYGHQRDQRHWKLCKLAQQLEYIRTVGVLQMPTAARRCLTCQRSQLPAHAWNVTCWSIGCLVMIAWRRK